MKRHFLQVALFAFVTLFALSCKKSSTSNNGTYFVKIKKNGTWISFATTAGELGPDGFNAAYTDFGVSAITTSGTERFDLTVQINGTNFATGTYHSSTIVSHPYINISYTYQPNATATPELYMIESVDGRPESAYTVNVTEITATTLRGTFTGNYLTDNFSGSGTVAEVTEGEFYVKRAR